MKITDLCPLCNEKLVEESKDLYFCNKCECFFPSEELELLNSQEKIDHFLQP